MDAPFDEPRDALLDEGQPPAWRPLTASDLDAWADLVNTLARADATEEFYDADDLAEEFTGAGFDPATDSWCLFGGAGPDGGEMVAYGTVHVADLPDGDGQVRCQLDGGVRPSHRGRGLGSSLVDLQERRAAELAAQRHPGLPAHLRCTGGVEGHAGPSSVRALLQHRGYRIVRWFVDMQLDVSAKASAVGAGPEVHPLDGVVLRSPAAADEDAVRSAHNLAFADHWGTVPQSPDRWRDFWRARAQRPGWSTLAMDAEGRVLAYVLVGQWTPREAYVSLVGTVPSARGRGLAMACLQHTLALLRASDAVDRVDLDVDADSPTGATRLYDRAGFSAVRSSAVMRRDLPTTSRVEG